MRRRFTDHPGLYKQAAAGVRREIPDDFKYNPKKLKHLKHILHNVSVALGTLTSSLNEFSRLKSPEISPDGLLGGVGYIIPIKEIKQTLITTVHGLSNIADCVADELTNPKWELKKEENNEVKKLIKEKDEAVERVEDISEDEGITPDDLVTFEDDADKGGENKNEGDLLETPEVPETPETAEETLQKKASVALSKAIKESLIDYFK